MYTTQEIRRVVKDYIGEFVNLDNLNDEINIFEAGLVNSLFAIELMTFLEKSFDIKVGMDDLDMSYFESIHAITEFVSRKEAEKVS
jgi:methoxymalonate biosynthesis acyl carrier protein